MIAEHYLKGGLSIFCSLLLYFTQAQQERIIELNNPLPEDRRDELIVLTRAMLEVKTGPIKPGQFIHLSDQKKRPMVVQFDDLNKDGNWDEAALLCNFKPNERLQLKLEISNQPATVKAVVRAHVRLRKKNIDDSFGPQLLKETMPFRNPATDFSKQPLPLYLTEGPAWENDKVAFRQYLDVRNVRDIFAKRVPQMVMDSVGVVAVPSYHNLADWGMDVLHVGKSLGAGAVALQVNINGRDSLLRLGGESITETDYEQLSDGPVRAAFRMSYKLQVNGVEVKFVDETSIAAGKYFYESRLRQQGLPAGARLVTGIANFNENVSKNFIANDLAVLYSHGKQSENKDELGMAVMVEKKRFTGVGATPDSGSSILNTYTLSQRLDGEPAKYRFYSAWGLSDPTFKDRHDFEQFLFSETRRINKPIHISIL